MVPRTPRKRGDCMDCEEENSIDDMVQCDGCKKWCHFQCAGVDSSVAEKNWQCKHCTQSKAVTGDVFDAEPNLVKASIRTSQNTDMHSMARPLQDLLASGENLLSYMELRDIVPISGDRVPTRPPSSLSSASSAKSRVQLELQRLEEQHNIEERHAKEREERERAYVQKKYELLSMEDPEDELQNLTKKAVSESHIPIVKSQTNVKRCCASATNIPKESYFTLTPEQLSSRQVLSKELPIFTGRPEEWPIFLSCYENSTRLCGFSDSENLSRLQRALRGDALAAVSSRLLIPSLVPEVISSLRMLFGRPAIIVKSLIDKIKTEPPPRADKLDSLISYALSVRSLQATMEAARLTNHLNNPILLQELVDRLPASLRLNWAMEAMKLGGDERNLTEFSDWLYGVAEAASTVTTIKLDTKVDRRHANVHDDVSIPMQMEVTSRAAGACYCCQQDHKLVECSEFRDLQLKRKWELVKHFSICECCLKHPKRFRCRDVNECGINGCTATHHQLLHNSERANENCNAHQSAQEENVLFRIVPVILHGKERSVETFAFLDSGSSLTLMDDEIADLLDLEGTVKPLCLKWTAQTERLEGNSRTVAVQISARSNVGEQFWLNDVRTVDNLALPSQSFQAMEAQRKYQHLKGLPLPSYRNACCRILIGLNNEKVTLALKVREGRLDEPVAIKTRLGWLVSGGGSKPKQTGIFHTYEACDCDHDHALQEMFHKYIALEDPVIGNLRMESIEEKRACEILELTTKRCATGFESGLLWRFDDTVMPDSYQMALKRLQCLERKMQLDPTLFRDVSQQMLNLISKGYARKLSSCELLEQHRRIWYLPTFVVKNANKPGKVRLVWDAAATVNGVSLNTLLLKGPDQLIALPDVLFAFRSRRIAVCGDISEMFHQIRVRQEDKHAQRFLWRNGDCSRQPDVYVMEVLTFGASCSPSIAQYVKNINARDFKQQFPRAAEAIMNSHYVDDFLDSVDEVDEAIQLARDVKMIHWRGGFYIRNWLSNSADVLKALEEPTTMENQLVVGADESVLSAKVLGLWWRPGTDMFTFTFRFTKAHEDILMGSRIPTKRELLRILMSIFDPLGFLTCYLTYLKVILKEVWMSKTDWDESISNELQNKWERWRKLLPMVECVQIPRCYSIMTAKEEVSVQLHVFTDASEHAMAAVAYLRISDGISTHCSIVAAKSKVAPQKPLSIPRMELQAALIGARLANKILKGHKLKIQRVVFWCDSKPVLSWLRGDPHKYKQFVMFRVAEITDITDIQNWRWVPTKQNVADDATKWAKTPSFDKNDRWFIGPLFLYESEEDWPLETKEAIVEHLEEFRPKFLLVHSEIVDEVLINVDRFSSFQRLQRSLAWVLRFVDNVNKRRKGYERTVGTLTSDELRRSQVQLIRIAQREIFGDEVAMISNGGFVPKSSKLYKCSPYLDEDEVLRLKGRIDGAWCVSEFTKRPVILPRDHRITILIVEYYHRRFHHRCQETVVNEVRQKFWVPRLRTLLKSIRRKCQTCRITQAVPTFPEMAPLPEARLSAFVRPFTYTGVDYFGPMLVTSGRKVEKRWGVLFTCLTIRAVHIEVAHSLSTDSCIMCVRNFIARRGVPREIYSDNGTNLKGAEKELREAFQSIDNDVIKNKFTSDETKWFFNPPGAPHMGGCWERLIGSVKNVLKEVVRNQRLQDESLRSMLIEVEAIVNARPLTYVSLDSDDAEALTPNHFLLGCSNGSKPIGCFDDKDLLLRKSWRISQQMSNMFWKRWIREYLPMLTRRTKWFRRSKNVEEGDVVIIVDETLPKGSWPKGIVVSTVKSSDGQVRRATVRTVTGVYNRPVVKLAILDVSKPMEGDTSVQAVASPGGRNVAAI